MLFTSKNDCADSLAQNCLSSPYENNRPSVVLLNGPHLKFEPNETVSQFIFPSDLNEAVEKKKEIGSSETESK